VRLLAAALGPGVGAARRRDRALVHDDAVKVRYGVTWKEEAEAPLSGRLEIGPRSFLLHPFDDDALVEREFAFDQLTSVEIRPPDERPTLVLRAADGRTIELESAVEKWILGDVLAHMFGHSLGGGTATRVLVVLTLRPGAHERAREIIAGGPPFDPSSTELVTHDVFLLDDQVLFLFGLDAVAARAQLAEPDFWRPLLAWSELVTGGARLAERIYSWQRSDEQGREAHLGLGL
jgi:hypothetical protein